jgi:hypothetical protein
MDAIRKKMQSLKGETDGLYATIAGFEEDARESVGRADQVHMISIAVQLGRYTLPSGRL